MLAGRNCWVFSYWEQDELPALLELCRETMDRQAPGRVCFLNPRQVAVLLPDLPSGPRWDNLRPQQRADLVRLELLARYGGAWLDADCIALQPLEPLLAELEQWEFIGFQVADRLRNPIMLARAGGEFITAAAQEARRRIEEGAERPAYNELGSGLLTRLWRQWEDERGNLRGEVPGLSIRERWRFASIRWDETRRFFAQGNAGAPERKWNRNAWTYHLTGKVVKAFEGRTRESILGGFGLVPELLRAGLGEVRPWRAAEMAGRLDPRQELRGVEVGVLFGRNSALLLQQLPRLQLAMVDRWAEPPAGGSYQASGDVNAFHSAAKFQRLKWRAAENTRFAADRRELIQEASPGAAARFEDASQDFVFIDADHSKEGCAADVAAWWPKVKPGGWIGGHDYGHRNPRWGVTQAVDEFAAGLGLEVERGRDLTWFLRKP